METHCFTIVHRSNRSLFLRRGKENTKNVSGLPLLFLEKAHAENFIVEYAQVPSDWEAVPCVVRF